MELRIETLNPSRSSTDAERRVATLALEKLADRLAALHFDGHLDVGHVEVEMPIPASRIGQPPFVGVDQLAEQIARQIMLKLAPQLLRAPTRTRPGEVPAGSGQTREEREVEAELAKANEELGWMLAESAADVAGIFDPTPTSDLVGAGLALRRGDVLGAGLNMLSMIPYVGDAVGKSIKGTRLATRLVELRARIAALVARLRALRQARHRPPQLPAPHVPPPPAPKPPAKPPEKPHPHVSTALIVANRRRFMTDPAWAREVTERFYKTGEVPEGFVKQRAYRIDTRGELPEAGFVPNPQRSYQTGQDFLHLSGSQWDVQKYHPYTRRYDYDPQVHVPGTRQVVADAHMYEMDVIGVSAKDLDELGVEGLHSTNYPKFEDVVLTTHVPKEAVVAQKRVYVTGEVVDVQKLPDEHPFWDYSGHSSFPSGTSGWETSNLPTRFWDLKLEEALPQGARVPRLNLPPTPPRPANPGAVSVVKSDRYVQVWDPARGGWNVHDRTSGFGSPAKGAADLELGAFVEFRKAAPGQIAPPTPKPTGAPPPVKLHTGGQGKHVPGHNNYEPGRSVFTHQDPEGLLATHAGKGTPVDPKLSFGQAGFRERVDFGQVIGEFVDSATGKSVPTTKGIIHYGKNGAHIVPARP